MLTVLIFDKEIEKIDQRPRELRVKYFSPLSETLDKFNEQYDLDVEIFYNQYNQKIPLTYKVQRTNLEIFY